MIKSNNPDCVEEKVKSNFKTTFTLVEIIDNSILMVFQDLIMLCAPLYKPFT